MGSEELEELRVIKKLLVLQLLERGIQASAIAELIGMDSGDFSKLFPVRKLLKNKPTDKKKAD